MYGTFFFSKKRSTAAAFSLISSCHVLLFPEIYSSQAQETSLSNYVFHFRASDSRSAVVAEIHVQNTFEIQRCHGKKKILSPNIPTRAMFGLRLRSKSISIQLQVCPPTSDYPRVFSENDLEAGPKSCHFPEALKIVEEKCHGQEECSMVTAPEVFGSNGLPAYAGGSDPCPGVRKYVEVAYKCKPTVFKSKVVCQGNDLKLECKSAANDTRIAIYSASFSASGGTHIYCPDEGKVDFASQFQQQACEEQYVTDTLMKICHGQRK